MGGFEIPKPEEVWLFRCTECGWHSDICQNQIHVCPNCKADVMYMSGTSKEIGDYLRRLMLWD